MERTLILIYTSSVGLDVYLIFPKQLVGHTFSKGFYPAVEKPSHISISQVQSGVILLNIYF